MSQSLPPGQVIGRRYVVERALDGEAGGRRAAVAAAPDGARVVVKTIGQRATEASEPAARLRREAEVAAKVSGPRTARVVESGDDDAGVPFLVMSWVEGETLAARLERGPLPVALAVDLATQICEALAPAHALGVAHRDVRPENVVLRPAPEGSVDACLLGFSFSTASAADAMRITSTGALIGAPDYTAPEQLRAAIASSPASDVWSVAALLHELVAGQPPFHADSVPRTCRRVLEEPAPSLRASGVDVPEALDEAILRCLDKDPRGRPPDAARLAELLAPFGGEAARAACALAAKALPAHSRTPSSRMPGGPPRTLVAAVVVALVLAAAWLVLARR